MNRGFTLIELIVSIGIFAVMTALVVAKYGNFNQTTLLTDTAYDVALALHTAQNYGLSTKNIGASANQFSSPYGLNFTMSSSNICGSASSDSSHIVLYADSDNNGICNNQDNAITTYTITRGAVVSSLCVMVSGGSCSSSVSNLDVSFKRPNPDATICASYNGGAPVCTYSYALVTIKGTDGSLRYISVRDNGQVSVFSKKSPIE